MNLTKNGNHITDIESEFMITRVFDAPAELLWKVHTEPKHLLHWWGPKGFKMLVADMDLRPGGMFFYGMESPDGHKMWGKFVYHEIVPGKKLVFVVSFSDENKGTTRHPLSETWPLEVLNTLTIELEGEKSRLTMKGKPVNATSQEIKTFNENHEGMRQGFKGTMDQLENYLAGLTK